MDDLLNLGSEALRKAALNEKAKAFILDNEVLFQTFKRAAARYIGGETLEETTVKVKEQNRNGLKCSIEFMGENTRTEKEANAATDEFVKICNTISLQKLHATVSLDLSHIGLSVSKDLGLHNLNSICKAAKEANTEVIISAEEADKTDAIIDCYMKTSGHYGNLGITVQAYLHRSKDDIKELIKTNGRICIVKGAFQTKEGLSIPRGEILDETYLAYVEELLSQKHKCSIATHHDKIQQEAKKLIHKYKPEQDLYEFESLYGIQTEQLMALKNEGHPAKVYFVYGKEWYLYLCNRIAEYPLNIFRALNDIVG